MVQRAFPAAPPYLALVFGVPILVGVLAWIAHHFHWIMPWYYLLPSLLFLLTFTVMPIGLTIFLAFTDYAGNRNTQLNPTTETTIVQAAGTQVETADLTSLRCEVLFEGCLGVRVRLYTAGTLEVQGVNLENNVLTVSPAPPRGAHRICS